MNKPLQSKYVDFHTKGIFRFFRIIITGPSCASYNPNVIRMDLNQIELFGKYYEGQYSEFTQDFSSKNHLRIAIIMLILFLVS